jgi:hypothetical protein
MPQTIKQLEKLVHRRYLSTLNLFRFIQQNAFCSAYEAANDEEKESVYKIIDSANLSLLQVWTIQMLKKYRILEYLDLKTLKDVAEGLLIKNNCNMSKGELIVYIRAKESHESNKIDRIVEGDGRVIDEIRQDATGAT